MIQVNSTTDTPLSAPKISVFQTVLRHRKKALAVFVTTLLVALVGVLFWPRTYWSQARLFVRIGRETVALDPTVTTGQMVGIQASRQSEINSVIEMLKTRTVVEKVVDVVGADEILEIPKDETWLGRLIREVKGSKKRLAALVSPNKKVGPSDGRVSAADQLERGVKAEAPRLSTVIALSYKASSPELAQKVLAAWVDVYTKEHMRMNRTAGSEEFFREQSELLNKQLQEAKAKLRDLKNTNVVASIEGQTKLLESQKERVVTEERRNARELAESEAKFLAITKALKSMDKTVMMQRVEGRTNVASDGMRQQLYALEVRGRELLENYTADHPLADGMKRIVSEVRKVHEAEKGARAETTFAVNPNHQNLERLFLEEEARLASLKATQKTILAQREVVFADVKQLNRYALELGTLEREARLLEDSYLAYAEKLEQSRIDTALESQEISNVNVVQKATLERDPIQPSRTLGAALGLFLAVTGAVGASLLAEHRDTRLRSVPAVESALEMPVLITIPRSQRQRLKV